jgi:hypothetical protein
MNDLKRKTDLTRQFRTARRRWTELLLSFAIVSVLAAVSLGQENPKASLIVEFERTPCDNFRGYLDFLGNKLTEHPDSTAHIFIFGESGNMRANVFYEGMIQGYLRQREFSTDRVRFVHTRFEKRLKFQVWLAQPGEEAPGLPVVDWSYKTSAGEKPYKFTWLNEYDDICPEVAGVELYAAFLKANPHASGNIVIRDTTNAKIRKLSQIATDELIRIHRVPRRQLRFFFVKKQPNGADERIEYWLVP